MQRARCRPSRRWYASAVAYGHGRPAVGVSDHHIIAAIHSVIGKPYSYTVAAYGYPKPTLTLAHCPDGMTMDDNGQIQWTPAAAGTFGVIVLAVNGIIPDAEQIFEIEVSPEPTAAAIASTPVLASGRCCLHVRRGGNGLPAALYLARHRAGRHDC